jgi:phosphotransferase system HPr (HPr) family protein
MGEQTVSRRVVVTNPQGLHARPADLFVKTASRFAAKVEVVKGHERVDGKSILAILTLASVQGTELVIEATGQDAQAAVDALAQLVAQNFSDGDSQAAAHP